MTLCETEVMDFNSWNILWSISFGILAFLTLIGNLLFDSADMLAGLASVFILAFICLERMHAIGWPLCLRSLSSRAYIFAIVPPWCLAAVVTSSRLLLYYFVRACHYFVVIVKISLTTPLVITISCYGFIWKALKSGLPNPHRNANDDKLAKTFLMVTGAFIILVVVINLCLPCQQILVKLVYIIKLLHFSNSVINVIIYPLRIPTFWEALLRVLHVRSCFRSRYQINQLNAGISVTSMTTIIEPLSSLSFDPTELQLQTEVVGKVAKMTSISAGLHQCSLNLKLQQ